MFTLYTHTHTQTYTQKHTDTRTRTHSPSHSNSHRHRHRHIKTETQTQKHIGTETHKRIHTTCLCDVNPCISNVCTRHTYEKYIRVNTYKYHMFARGIYIYVCTIKAYTYVNTYTYHMYAQGIHICMHKTYTYTYHMYVRDIHIREYICMSYICVHPIISYVCTRHTYKAYI